jgi:hypothetical protein
MQRQPNKPYEKQGGCNRRVSNKGLSKATQDALRAKQERDEQRAIDNAYSLEGLLND